MTTSFPKSFDFAGFNEPVRMECDIYDLVIEGNLPDEIDGSFYRLTPDPQYPPRLGDDTFLSGDGMISLFRFENGHVDMKMRYVMTERLKDDRAARKSLHGAYRNPLTDDPSVEGHKRGAANTTPIWHGKKLLALKEDSRAMEVDKDTLETIGEWDYDGKLQSETVTAHTRWDPDTDELYFYGYEASGLCSNDIAYCVADKDGRLTKEEHFEGPYVSLMHDFVVTKEHAIFPFFPITTSMDLLKAGKPHWAWDPSKESHFAIMPRDGSVKDLVWFKRPACSVFHFLNAYTEGNKVHVDACYNAVNPFPFIMEAAGLQHDPANMQGALKRWTFDLSKPGSAIDQYDLGPGGDMPRVADKDLMKEFDIAYYETFDPEQGPPNIAGPIGVGFNTLIRLEVKSGKMKSYCDGPHSTLSEAVHIPSKKSGHEGYLALVNDDHQKYLSEMWVMEAADIDKGPIARIKLPMRLRNQVHGNWVEADRLS
ncbi:MAG TPA: carotenoid oxygenase family protein [Alphaproteobacteria bacterium]|nr:carotenoid oxygenase family protein [Alphaproteobacteria bacterium]